MSSNATLVEDTALLTSMAERLRGQRLESAGAPTRIEASENDLEQTVSD